MTILAVRTSLSTLARVRTTQVVLACIGLYAALHFIHLPGYASNPRHRYLGSLLLTTPDGYYYLRLAADLSTGNYGPDDPARPAPRPMPAPLISRLAVAAHQVLGVSLMNAAFFIPPTMAFGLVLALWLLGASIGRPWTGLLAGVAASSSFLWYTRVIIGAFDTDCLILPLFVGGLACFHRSGMARPSRWPLWMTAGLAQIALLAAWWPHAGLFASAIVLATWAAGAVFPGRRWERGIKAATLLLGLALGAWLLLGRPPGPMGDLSDTLHRHLELVFKAQKADSFAETGATVAELDVTPPLEAASDVSGHWLVFMAAACGFAALAARHPRAAFAVGLPCLALGAASFWGGNRFLMFLAPIHGLGIAWLCAGLVLPALRRRGTTAPAAAALTLGLLLCAPSAWSCMSARVLPTSDYNAVELASVINRQAPEDAFVWNWWGPGYMMEYFTRRECLIDGGLQDPKRTYVSALPFATNDPLLARNWIRFFATHHNGLEMMTQFTGSLEDSAALLKQVFSRPGDMEDILAAHNVPADLDWKAVLFPERDVYVIMLAEMLLRSSWNMLGRWDPATGTAPDVRIFMTPEQEVRLNRKKGVALNSSGETIPYSRIYFITPRNLSHDKPRDTGPVAIRVWGMPYLYTIEQDYFDCLAYRLLFVHPEDTPGFQPLVYNPFIGGIWKVL